MPIIPTSFAKHIGEKLSKNFSVVWPKKNRDGKIKFPDGESYAALPKLDKKERYTVIHTGMPNPNDGLMELKIILGILKNNQIPNVEVCFTYFPYGMQDAVFDPGEQNVAEGLIKEFFEYFKVKRIHVIDAHFSSKKWINQYPVYNIPAFEPMKREVLKKYPDILFLVPDLGCQKRTRLQGTEKKRLNSYLVEIKDNTGLKKLVNNRAIGVVDDIIETGGTMERFALECQKLECKKLVAVITHGVLKKGIDRIKKNYQDLFLTNSISRQESNIDITPSLIKYLKL